MSFIKVTRFYSLNFKMYIYFFLDKEFILHKAYCVLMPVTAVISQYSLQKYLAWWTHLIDSRVDLSQQTQIFSLPSTVFSELVAVFCFIFINLIASIDTLMQLAEHKGPSLHSFKGSFRAQAGSRFAQSCKENTCHWLEACG